VSLTFEVLGARAEPHAAQPMLVLRLRVTETSGAAVHAAVLQCQIRIEPQLRRYGPDEQERLVELFGEPGRWGDTLRPFLWTHVSAAVGSVDGSTELDLAVPCTYDMEVAGTKYLHCLADGSDVPLVLLFSGTAFAVHDGTLQVTPVPWHEEASFRLPVATWRDVMDRYFPDQGWIVASRATLDALGRFKAARALATWDQTLEQLLAEAGEPAP
jgi:hypothetical protein